VADLWTDDLAALGDRTRIGLPSIETTRAAILSNVSTQESNMRLFKQRPAFTVLVVLAVLVLFAPVAYAIVDRVLLSVDIEKSAPEIEQDLKHQLQAAGVTAEVEAEKSDDKVEIRIDSDDPDLGSKLDVIVPNLPDNARVEHEHRQLQTRIELACELDEAQQQRITDVVSDRAFIDLLTDRPADQPAAELAAEVRKLLEEAGFARYEVSAYARPGYEARHNLNYWQFGDYLGIGAGAHGKLTTAEGVVRTTRRRHPQAWQKEAGTSAARLLETVTPPALVTEFMLNALRLARGFPRALFAARTGLPDAALEPGVRAAVARGWLDEAEGWLRPTPAGYRFLNDLQLLFVS